MTKKISNQYNYDFEPEYTIDEHIKKMIEIINEGEDILTPIF